MSEPTATAATHKPDSGLFVEGDFTIRIPCDAPAPLVANGAHYIGCSLAKDHEGQHEITVKWDR